VPVDGRKPEAGGADEALSFMGFGAGQPIAGVKIDVAFVGSCTNGRLSDLREAARPCGRHVAKHVRALVVPGSQAVRLAAEREGLHEVFADAGFECAAQAARCLAMNPDRLEGRESARRRPIAISRGAAGSPTGRTLL
jgi:3-isopropylmalate/(R)-2-methylmalate dehydratase large subunit